MGSIVYKPHCSKCGALIESKISWKKIIEDVESNKFLKREFAEVHPFRCKACGEVFECIEITPPEEQPTEHR